MELREKRNFLGVAKEIERGESVVVQTREWTRHSERSGVSMAKDGNDDKPWQKTPWRLWWWH
jgi:hypothetical protein